MNNDGCDGCALVAYNYGNLMLFQCSIKGATSAILAKKSTITASNCNISNNSKAGIEACDYSSIVLDECIVTSNKYAFVLDDTVSTTLIRCDIRNNMDGVTQILGSDHSIVTKKCTGDASSTIFLDRYSYKFHSNEFDYITNSDVQSENIVDTKKRPREIIEFSKDYIYIDVNSSSIVEDASFPSVDSISLSKKLKISL
jgi:hypothetical protein